VLSLSSLSEGMRSDAAGACLHVPWDFMPSGYIEKGQDALTWRPSQGERASACAQAAKGIWSSVVKRRAHMVLRGGSGPDASGFTLTEDARNWFKFDKSKNKIVSWEHQSSGPMALPLEVYYATTLLGYITISIPMALPLEVYYATRLYNYIYTHGPSLGGVRALCEGDRGAL
jgi:hypothetical protein